MDSAVAYPIPIMRTKLHRPRVTEDNLDRSSLLPNLDTNSNLCLILLSAAAGYGKSTLISQWLSQHSCKSVWLSLDYADDDLLRFASYLIAAINNSLGNICTQTLSQLQSEPRLDWRTLAGTICNDLDDVEGTFVIALDNYDRIHSNDIHCFIDAILAHPPKNVCLILMTRQDPPLSLVALRARNSLYEIRLKQLRFSSEHSTSLLVQASNGEISEQSINRLNDIIEGWPVALRLMALSLAGHKNPEELISKYKGTSQRINEFLASEIMQHQSETMRKQLQLASVLDSFCALLCDHIWSKFGISEYNGQSFIDQLILTGLLTISLDDNQEWFRFHHLFQEMLQKQLATNNSSEVIAELHRSASEWYVKEELFEDAYKHIVAADGLVAAADLIAPHLNAIANTEKWSWVESWLSRIPEEIINQSPDFLVLKAFLLQNRGFVEESALLLENIEKLLSDLPEKRGAQGTVYTVQAMHHCFAGNPDKALQLIDQASSLLTPDAYMIRGMALLVRVVAQCFKGNTSQARDIVSEALAEPARHDAEQTYQARAFIALAFMHWWNAELKETEQAGSKVIELHRHFPVPQSMTFARYLIGASLYDQNKLEQCVKLLEPVLDDPIIYNPRFFLQSGFVLIDAYQAIGASKSARHTIDQLVLKMQVLGTTHLLVPTLAFQADLAMRQGRHAHAMRWAKSFKWDGSALVAQYSPNLTCIKQLMLTENAANLDEAITLLDRYISDARNFSAVRLLIDPLAIRAIVLDMQGRSEDAVHSLEEAVMLALPGGVIRVFVDLGQPIAQLLSRVRAEDEFLQFIGEILAAFRTAENSSGSSSTLVQQSPLDPLSKRELEVLGLLAKRLSNREIGDQLFISVGTVKRHAANIYQKLSVEGRRRAVAKAIGLGILPEN